MYHQDVCVPAQSDILVVDDVPANLQLISGLLSQKGYKVRPVPSGKLALQAIASRHPDLILLDIRMPEMNGYEVCERLKADPELRDIPIIFLSALNETEDKVKGFFAGAVDYVTKPVQIEELEARVQTHLELRAQRIELERRYRRLLELEGLRDSLVHMIVHDMRTPLSVALSCYELINDGSLSEDKIDLVKMGSASLNSLTNMVNAVLDIGKIESGKMSLKFRECDLAAIATGVVESMRVLAASRTITLDGVSSPVVAMADEELVTRVVQNLFQNAVNHTPAHSTVRVRVETAGDDVSVFLEDEGPGIPPEFVDKIFEKYGRIDQGDFVRHYSTGLGLTFCKLAVEAHGGRIGVESVRKKGSTFWFTLPRRATRAKEGNCLDSH